MKKLTKVLFAVALLSGLVFGIRACFAAAVPAIDENNRVVLHGNVHPKAGAKFDIGPTDPSLPMNRIILLLKIAPDKQAALNRLLAEQQDPASPNYHRWLKPEEFGERFGRSPEEIQTVKSWLISHGFAIEETAKGGGWINFSGTASQVESAFRVKMHDYKVEGRLHHANSTDPSIPRVLSDIVAGPVTLHNFHHEAAHSMRLPMPDGERQPGYTDSNGYHSLAPGDFAVIYDVNAVYGQGYTGQGVTIAVVERTHPDSSKWETFRSTFGLPVNPPHVQVTVNATSSDPDPGDLGAEEDAEADLDVEWAGAVAPDAIIDCVVSGSTQSADGVDLSAQYIVDSNLAPIVSDSFYSCESDMGSTWLAFYNNLWQEAAIQGITVFVVTGDTGAYACSDINGYPISPKAVNGLGSTPYNIAVGGTRFNDSDIYWNNSNTADGVSALSYIPELAWNDLWAYTPSSGYTVQDYEAASGGGPSSIYLKPPWQVSPGVPPDGARDVPDVSLNADNINVPYQVFTCTNSSGPCTSNPANSWSLYGGTSAASPSFAGIMALLVQRAGGVRQGNFNTSFYQFGQAQYGNQSGALAVFHDITSGTNGFVGSGADLPGYSCGTGYDLVTGLGSVDALNLLLAFQETLSGIHFAVAANSSTTAGSALNFTVTPLDSNNNVLQDYSCTVHFTSTDRSAVLPINAALTGPGTFSAVLNTAGNQTITATNTLNSEITGTSNAIAVSPPPGSLTVTILPQGADTAGAQWSADGGSTWHTSGTVSLPAGSYTVSFRTITGWTAPAPQNVTVSSGRTTTVTGSYVQQMGYIKTTITPQAAILAGAEWSYDGGKTWHPSGATVLLPVSAYTITFKGITGWNAPEAQGITVLQNQTAAVSGVYVQQTGSLTVDITPQAAITQGAEWSYNGGVSWQKSGTVSLPVGAYTIVFKAAAGWNTPAAQKATVTYGGSATVSGAYVQQTGSLIVTITPAGAVAADGQWSIDGGITWYTGGVTLKGIAVGLHTLSFKPVTGWTAPNSRTVTVSNNLTTPAVGAYVQQMGYIKATVTPVGAVAAGAEWSYDGGKTWHLNATMALVPIGAYTVTFRAITGWNAPEAQAVTVLQSQIAAASGPYVQQTGSLAAGITPQTALTQGAEWSYNGGVSWQTNGTISLPVGTYTVIFKPVAGWNTPAAQKATVTYGGSAAVPGAYVQQTGSLIVTITPAGAVTAEGQWSIDGGITWCNGGVTLKGITVGPHTLSFKTITGWTAPAPRAVTVSNNLTTPAIGAYVQQVGSIKVTITPQAAVAAGAEWSYDGGKTWHLSGTTVSNLPVSGSYTITFKNITGWIAPENQTVAVANGQTAPVGGLYTQ